MSLLSAVLHSPWKQDRVNKGDDIGIWVLIYPRPLESVLIVTMTAKALADTPILEDRVALTARRAAMGVRLFKINGWIP